MKKLLYKIFGCFAAVSLAVFMPISASAETRARYELPFEPASASYLLVSLDTGEVIFEKDSHTKRTPASLTKLLTSYVAMKYTDNLDTETVTQTTKHTDELFGMNSSTADIRNGETLTMRQLLYAMLLPSGNEAANMVADHIGKGSKSNFCMLMNTEAKRMGCTDTHFSNPHGLFSDEHYTTAYDMYLIAKACYETPGFMEIATTTHYYLPANTKHADKYLISSTIKMQDKGYPELYRSYIRGLKTGSTEEAGRNFVTVCEKDGEKYILVVMGAPYYNSDGSQNKNAAFEDTANIMDYFFDNYSLKPANGLDAPVTEVALRYVKDKDNLLLYPKEQVYSVLPNDVDESAFQKIFDIPEQVYAPINAGDAVGTVSYYIAGDLVGTTELIAAESYQRNNVIFIIEKIKAFIGSLYFKVVLIVTFVLIAALLIFRYWLGKKYEKMQKVHRKNR